jgi:surface antigen
MKPSVVAILALAGPTLAGCAGFGGESAPARPTMRPATGASPLAAQPMAPVGSVQAQPLPPPTPGSAASTQPALPKFPVATAPGQPSPPTAPIGAASTQSPAPAIPSGAALGAVLGGPVGASLTEADRQAAWNAQIAALDSGQSRSWRGEHGVFGFVAPGAETGGGCRAYSQTIYVAGRPNRGEGVACKQADGTWKITS